MHSIRGFPRQAGASDGKCCAPNLARYWRNGSGSDPDEAIFQTFDHHFETTSLMNGRRLIRQISQHVAGVQKLGFASLAHFMASLI
jgi:hypothetical protein